jgi:hypothetical protein
MTVADKLRVEHRSTPCAPGRGARMRRRMRRAHDPSRFRRRRIWRRRDPQEKAGDAGGLRSQGQLAACHQIEPPRVAPDFQHHGAQRIAGERVRGRPQRALDIGGAHAHHQARIEAEFGEPIHRQRACFNFGKILPHPDQRPACRGPSHEPCEEAGRNGALMSLAKHLMHRAQNKPALKRRIGLGMAEPRLVERTGAAMRLDLLDRAAQSRKRVRACAGHHAPLPQVRYWSSWSLKGEPITGSIVHDMF